ncbi:unnamed protein product [Lymnaea stagnalis]|uniref:Protein quiver n=1 Tax=Lymnaea stagnalis TaxID=6523 RepID=A0AAV2IEE1_LYMST
MLIDGAMCLAVLVAVLDKMVQGTILCSTCESDVRKNCESQPPEPQPCPGGGTGVVEACAIVRISNKRTGELNKFIRSCSNSNISGCFDSVPGFITCADICRTDGCNMAHSLHMPVKASYYFPVLLTVLKMRFGHG